MNVEYLAQELAAHLVLARPLVCMDLEATGLWPGHDVCRVFWTRWVPVVVCLLQHSIKLPAFNRWPARRSLPESRTGGSCGSQ